MNMILLVHSLKRREISDYFMVNNGTFHKYDWVQLVDELFAKNEIKTGPNNQ